LPVCLQKFFHFVTSRGNDSMIQNSRICSRSILLQGSISRQLRIFNPCSNRQYDLKQLNLLAKHFYYRRSISRQVPVFNPYTRIGNAYLTRNRSPIAKYFASRFDCSRFIPVVLRNLDIDKCGLNPCRVMSYEGTA